VLNFFRSKKRTPKPSPPRERTQKPAEQVSVATSPAKIISEAKLQEIMANDDLALAGRAQLISLHAIKNRLGEKWASLKDRMFPVFENCFERRFGNREKIYKKSEVEYIVIFSGQLAATKSSRDMVEMCRTVLEEVGRKFTGEHMLDQEDVRTVFGYENGVFAFTPEDREKLKQKPEQEENKSRLDLFISGETFDIVYRPLWNVKHQTITTYTVHARSTAADGSMRYDYNVLKDKTSLEAKIGLDWILLEDAALTMQGLYDNKFRTIYTIPVSYETVFSKERLKGFTGQCQKIPEELRKYVIFNLTLCPAGIPQSKLQMIVVWLKPYCNSIQIDLTTLPRDLQKYKIPGLSYMKYDLPRVLKDTKKTWMDLAEFSIKCRKLDLKTVIGNVNTVDHAMLAREIGANFISGDIIGDYCDIPEHMQRRSWQEVVERTG